MSLPDIKVITVADEKYFHLAQNLARTVEKKIGINLAIVDIGLTSEQRNAFDGYVLDGPQTHIPSDIGSGGFIKAAYKARAILDAINYFSQAVLYLDADCLVIENFPRSTFDDCDVAVTPRHPRENSERHLSNGCLNSGVLYFNNTNDSLRLLKRWCSELERSQKTDQKALSDLLQKVFKTGASNTSGVDPACQVKLLDPCVFNNVGLDGGCVVHHKNVLRSARGKRRYEIDLFLARWFPYCRNFVIRQIIPRRWRKCSGSGDVWQSLQN